MLIAMKNTALLFFMFFVLISCNNNRQPIVLSPSNLKSYYVNINVDSGYILKTPNGASIKILPNSFNAPSNTKVNIEIKEAYSIQEILLGGLSTQSGGKPLRSAGMIYFRATVANNEITFNKPVQIIIPAKVYDASMQVYTGIANEDSTINWTKPTAIDTSIAMNNLLSGQRFFLQKCASCHHPSLRLIGPPLAGVRERAPYPDWPYQFVNNSSKLIRRDPYAKKIYDEYQKIQMTAFPELSRSTIKAILDYCDNEAQLNPDRNPEPVEADCGYDTLYYAALKENIEVATFRDDTNEVNAMIVEDEIDSPLSYSPSASTDKEDEFEKKGFRFITPPEGMYQFNITQSGWFNIDVLFDDPAAGKVQLFAKLQTKQKNDPIIYLCIPKRKILMRANRESNGMFVFDYSDPEGYLPLVVNDDAYVLGITSVEDKIYFGIEKFKIEPKQTISLKLLESTEGELLKAIKNNYLEGITLDTEKKEMEVVKKPCNYGTLPAPANVNNRDTTMNK
jgi:mono/diheme cytochrome c family protein